MMVRVTVPSINKLILVFCLCQSSTRNISIFWAPVFLVYEPIKQSVVCIKYFVQFKNLTDEDEIVVNEKLNKILSADFALLHHKFYMVLIEDAAQVILGTAYLADSSRWYYENQQNGSQVLSLECTGKYCKHTFTTSRLTTIS